MNVHDPHASETPTAPASKPLEDSIRKSLKVLIKPGDVVEVRILKTLKGTVSGYYTDLDALARDVARWNGQAEGVYFTPNPVDPTLLARSPNRLTSRARSTTSDSDVARRRWLPIDLDPKRPSGVSSTDAEHAAALTRAYEIRSVLQAEGWPDPILADSGNGAHLLYGVDLPNDSAATTLIRRILQALDLRFTDAAVSVDLTTFNAARLVKVYGTLAAKGSNTADRPHRASALVEVPTC